MTTSSIIYSVVVVVVDGGVVVVVVVTSFVVFVVVTSLVVFVSFSATCADQNAALIPLSDIYCAHDNLNKQRQCCILNKMSHTHLCCHDNKSALLINRRFTFLSLNSLTYLSCK